MKVFFAESELWGSLGDDFKSAYEHELTKAHHDAAELLTGLPQHVNYFVTPAPWSTIKETGDGGNTRDSRLVVISLDPNSEVGSEGLLKHVRATVFHELNHCLRYELGIWHESFLDNCVMEGLATVFEREHSGESPLWGEYEREETTKWYEEIVQAGSSINHSHYMFNHPDGRRWIGYKTGAYIVDTAIEKSGLSVIELTGKSCDEIVRLASL